VDFIIIRDEIIIKKLRVISIKNSKLLVIRNNLRLIIFHAVNDYKTFLRSIWLITTNKSQSENLSNQMEELSEFFDRSICICMVCQNIMNDMVYIPHHKAWFCVSCWKSNLVPF